MSNKLKIALLCNNKMALPAMQIMHAQGVLCGVATADKDHEVVQMVSAAAKDFNIPYTKITNKDRWEQMEEWLRTMQPDAMFVMTFPWKIPEHIMRMTRLGFINFHYGLLPEMRGADPVFETIRQQHEKAGVTVHIMDGGFDTGPVLMKEEVPVNAEFTYGLLCGQLAMKAADMCHTLLQDMEQGILPPAIVQDNTKAKYWPKINKQEFSINWEQMDHAQIRAMVKACNPIARGVPVKLNGWEFGVYDTAEISLPGGLPAIAPGTIVALDAQNGLVVCCRDGKAIKIEVISTAEGVFPGYKLMNWGIKPGMVFS